MQAQKSIQAQTRKHLILYEAFVKALKDSGIKKLPELAALQKEYSALKKRKEAIYSDYGKLKQKSKEYQKIQQNVDTILQKENLGK